MKRSARYLAVLVLALGIGIPAVLAHTGAFTDVPHGAAFHDEINAIKTAGITTGCGATTYCPEQSVRRDAMAAFMKRGFGSVDRESAIGSLPIPEGATIVDSTNVAVPGASIAGAVQFVKIDAKVEVAVSGTVCDCEFVLFLSDINGATSDGSLFQTNASSVTTQTMTDSWVFEAPPGLQQYFLFALATDNNPGTNLEFNTAYVRLISTTYPFGSLAPTALSTNSSSSRTSRIDEADIREAIRKAR